jgi:site-specific DNA-methyltransferase (adenine-specific)
MLEINRIYNEDCLEGMKKIDDGSVDMILCDLPYGTTQNKWDSVIPLDKLWEQYNRIIKPSGAVVLTASGRFTAELMMSNIKYWKYNLVWQKTTPTGFLNAKKMPLRIHEDICVFYKKLPIYNPQKTKGNPRKVSKATHKINCKETTNYGKHNLSTYDSTERYPTSIFKFPTDKQKSSLHPTQKPVALFEYLIKTYTNKGDLVLDNCIGSGTTAVAAIDTNRNFIGFELDKDYFDIANERINATPMTTPSTHQYTKEA